MPFKTTRARLLRNVLLPCATAVGLAGCVSMGEIEWKKADGQFLSNEDAVACGATIQGGKRVVAFDKNTFYSDCLKSKGYAVTGQDRPRGPVTWTNASGVKLGASCQGLFIPRIERKRIEGIVPQWNLHFYNESDKRYTAKLDVVYEQAGRGGRTSEQFSFVVRAKTQLVQPLVGVPGEARIVEVDVFRCDLP